MATHINAIATEVTKVFKNNFWAQEFLHLKDASEEGMLRTFSPPLPMGHMVPRIFCDTLKKDVELFQPLHRASSIYKPLATFLKPPTWAFSVH